MSRTIKKLFLLILLLIPLALIAQEDSRYNAGMNLPFNDKAGDVNPQTGDLSLSYTDISLPGRAGMDFSFGRSWSLSRSNVFNMYNNKTLGIDRLNSNTPDSLNRIGTGWSSTLPYILDDNSSGKLVKTLFLGSAYEIDQTMLSVIDPNRSNLLGYDLLDKRIYADSSIAYSDITGKNITDLTSEYHIESESRSAYVLILKDNSKYWFGSDGQVMMQQDKTGLNRIWYFYEKPMGVERARLKVVVDSIGREIKFSYDENNNLKNIKWDVERGVKNLNETRELVTETKTVEYIYEDAENYLEINSLKDIVLNYRKPYILKAVIDPMGNRTEYNYKEGTAGFTFDSSKSRSSNVFLLLEEIIQNTTDDGKLLNKRIFEYKLPENSASKMYTRKFFNGFMEYYKISREYTVNRHGKEFNDRKYIYNENGTAGNYNSYTTVITSKGLKSTYTYSLENNPAKKNVLTSLLTESDDGYLNLVENVYDKSRKKTFQSTRINGTYVFDEDFDYDDKGNLKWIRDKVGLESFTEFDPIYSIPVRQVQLFQYDGIKENYETETVINNLGQVVKEIVYLKTDDDLKKAITTTQYTYDSFGNVITVTNAHNDTIETEYDSVYNAFPVKTSQYVTIDSWTDGDVDSGWKSEPDTKKRIKAFSNKIFNSDGSIWIELDIENYGIEYYYDTLGTKIEAVNPDEDDYRDFEDITNPGKLELFLSSRENNPGSRMEIDYQKDFVKTFSDIDKEKGHIQISSVQKDGLGHVEEEVEYGSDGLPYSKKIMQYDSLGNMVALTDPDANLNEEPKIMLVNDTEVKRFDKTWVIKYDDLGRTKRVLYPQTRPGINDIKTVSYDDINNSTITTDPEERTVYEKSDWNGNIIEVIGYGDSKTNDSEYQSYNYSFDGLNRKRSFTDAMGLVTTYRYDERNLLLEQNYGTESGSDTMAYDDLGQLITKSDRKGQLLSFVYDEMGRNTLINHFSDINDYNADNPVRSVRTIYDKRGNTVRVDNNGLIEHYIYDSANRVSRLDRKIADDQINTEASILLNLNSDDPVFSFDYNYNDAGMVTSMTYPDGSVNSFKYDSTLARLENISTDSELFVTDINYNKSGVVTDMMWGNGVTQKWDFDNRKRISNIGILRDQSYYIENLKYTLNGNGDILSINDNSYAYDGFNRIIGADTLNPGFKDHLKSVRSYFGSFKNKSFPGLPIFDSEADLNKDNRVDVDDHVMAILEGREELYDVESFTYDQNGNRLTLTQNDDVYSYSYGIRNRLENISLRKKNEFTNNLFAEYKYDANGNTVKRTIYKDDGTDIIEFEYDVLNRLTSTIEAEGTSTYLYDNAGNRFIKKDKKGDITLYLRHGQIAVAMDIELKADKSEELGSVNRYILSGDLTAGRITKKVKADSSEEIKKSYYHLDHLNSTKVITDKDGKVEVNYTYRAFGEQLKRLNESGDKVGDLAKYSYGGKELDDDTNLYYFNARFYDATTGRFINVDPIQDGTNWYIYCNNNPLNMIDSTGLFAQAVVGALTGAATSASIEIASQVISNIRSGNSLKKSFKSIKWGKVGASALGGAVSGAITGGLSGIANAARFAKTTKVLISAGSSAAGGATQKVSNNAIEGKKLSSGLGDAAITGAISGAITGSLGKAKQDVSITSRSGTYSYKGDLGSKTGKAAARSSIVNTTRKVGDKIGEVAKSVISSSAVSKAKDHSSKKHP